MPVKTRRWNDPVERDDGLRVLITRYRPRGVRKDRETWESWMPQLGPSARLLADFKAERAAWPEYRERYLEEMKAQDYRVEGLAQMVAKGETVTLLCSSSCHDPARCHRTLLAELIARKAGR